MAAKRLTKKKRAEIGRAMQALRKTRAGGRPLKYPRCPCGTYTAARAAKRKHACSAPK